MAIDASIPLQVQAPANPLAQYTQLAQLQAMQTQGKLADVQLQGQQRAQERQNKLSQLLSGDYATPDAREQALLKGGFADESLKLGKDRRENTKIQTDTEATQFKTAHEKIIALQNVIGAARDPASYMQALQAAQSMGLDVSKAPQQFDPAYVQNAGLQAQTAKERLEAEARKRGLDIQALSQQEAGRHNRASEGLTARGQNMTDARARETTAATLTKPFEITGEDGKPVLVQQDKQGNIKPVQGYTPKQGASKPLTDSQSKALLFGSRMQESGAILDELADQGRTTSVPGSRAPVVGAAITALSGEKNQKLEQAKRDFINATLRRESGAVIADSEFDNAEKQYFPQIGDSEAVKAQKKRNREVATRGILSEVPDSENRVAKVRATPKTTTPNIDALLDKYK